MKEELQKASPGRRTNWKEHKKLMIKSGFYDSDSNESYRCLIKAVQKEQGSLPSVEKHADMLSSNKLQGLKEKIGELHYAKFAEQQERRELNRVKRDM
ncbi:MAG: hypothetical protein Q4E87_01655, partial [bacterium]|nr:hypothetical protein [bacterium]